MADPEGSGQRTAVVLIACLIVGAYLYLNDTVWRFVQHVLLRERTECSAGT